MFRERSGAAALSGRDLPADQTLAALAQRQRPRPACTRSPGRSRRSGWTSLRATAYLDILNDVAAQDRIAYGLLSPDDDAPDDDAPDDDEAPDAPGIPDAAVGRGGSDCPCDECDGRCAPPDDATSPTTTNPAPANRNLVTTARAPANRVTAAPAGAARETAASHPVAAVPAGTRGRAPAALARAADRGGPPAGHR